VTHADYRGDSSHEGSAVSEQREILTWEAFGEASRELAVQVARSGYEPDMILAIARGGLMPAGALGYALAVKNTYTLNVEYYSGVNERLPIPIMLPPVPSMVDIRDSRVLIVDDVADTGHTLKLVNEFCLGQVRESRIAVLYEKPRSIVKVDYCWRRTDKWVNFPWSDTDPVVQRAGLVADA